LPTDDAAAANLGDRRAAKIGNPTSANLGKPPAANLGNVYPIALARRNLPTLADRRQVLALQELTWYAPAGKPICPDGFYWQASGSKVANKKNPRSKVTAGWLLIKNGKCQSCGDRFRPPICYLKATAWQSLHKESYERQKAEITFLVAKGRHKLEHLRCPECVQRSYGAGPGIGRVG
jgi:hypothetical protein